MAQLRHRLLSARLPGARVTCIAFTAEAFEAIKATLPLGSVAFEPTIDKKGNGDLA
jgi:hypothetical protein